jgi:NAD(P)-dependent dehydrogenase (short-subunit alcohol dehydrogenase family)
LAGKVAAVVGGASGIGAAISRALADAGVDVALCDRKAEGADSLIRVINDRGQRAVAIQADATDPDELAGFYGAADQLGRLDIVVNVVGGVQRRPFMDSTPQEWAGDIQRNYLYVLHSVQQAVPRIRSGGIGGSIINFTTIEAHRGAAGFAVYSGAKAALTNFTRAIAVELGADRIRVNAIAPDTTPSEGNANALPAEMLADMAQAPDLMVEAMRMYIPLQSPPMPDDIANAVLYLASDLSGGVTGSVIHVDGGTMAAAGMINWPSGGHLPVPPIPLLRQIVGAPIAPNQAAP